MNKICTSLEQSKKLIELGVDINTADMYFNIYQDLCFPIGNFKIDWNFIQNDEAVPAWSLSALLSLLKPCDGETYTIRGTLDGGATIEFRRITNVMCQEDNPLDAVFEMVCWLKENNKI